MSHPITEIAADVERSARKIAARWPGVVDADDLNQEVCLRLLTIKDYPKKLAGLDPAARVSVLDKIANQIASALRDEYEHWSGQSFYCYDEVQALLERHALTDERAEFEADRMDLFDGLISLYRASPAYGRIIADVHMLREPVGDSTRRTRLQRAVESLVKHMNRAHEDRVRAAPEPGPGSRKALPNSAAQAITGRSY